MWPKRKFKFFSEVLGIFFFLKFINEKIFHFNLIFRILAKPGTPKKNRWAGPQRVRPICIIP
jgi:hypothetical protein